MGMFTRWLDHWFEGKTRAVAQQSSRRGALVKIGRVLVAGAFTLPVLPFDRTGQAHAAEAKKKKQATDDTQCDYWRYCAQDGYLCSCCGGTVSTCPPGTEPSKVSWVGTCRNPVDGKDYLISYNDCCGKTSCGRCMCATSERERPGYRLSLHNDINWCMANDSSVFHCTTALIVGLPEEGA